MRLFARWRRTVPTGYHPGYRFPVTTLGPVTGMDPRRADRVAWTLRNLGVARRRDLHRPAHVSHQDLARVHTGRVVVVDAHPPEGAAAWGRTAMGSPIGRLPRRTSPGPSEWGWLGPACCWASTPPRASSWHSNRTVCWVGSARLAMAGFDCSSTPMAPESVRGEWAVALAATRNSCWSSWSSSAGHWGRYRPAGSRAALPPPVHPSPFACGLHPGTVTASRSGGSGPRAGPRVRRTAPADGRPVEARGRGGAPVLVSRRLCRPLRPVLRRPADWDQAVARERERVRLGVG